MAQGRGRFRFGITAEQSDREGIRRHILDNWMRRAAENPEGVGYADFSLDGKLCGLEIYCAPVGGVNATIEIDRRVLDVAADEVVKSLGGLLPADRVDDLGRSWQVRFYSTEGFPEYVVRLLYQLCGPAVGQQLEIREWWS